MRFVKIIFKTLVKSFPNFTSMPFDCLLISWVTNYIYNRGLFSFENSNNKVEIVIRNRYRNFADFLCSLSMFPAKLLTCRQFLSIYFFEFIYSFSQLHDLQSSNYLLNIYLLTINYTVNNL